MGVKHTLYLAGNFNSVGLIPGTIMTILDWRNCENCEVVLHSHCYLQYCNENIFILAIKEGHVSTSSASKDFQVIEDYSLPGSKKKSNLHLQSYKTELETSGRQSVAFQSFKRRTIWGYFPIIQIIFPIIYYLLFPIIYLFFPIFYWHSEILYCRAGVCFERDSGEMRF